MSSIKSETLVKTVKPPQWALFQIPVRQLAYMTLFVLFVAAIADAQVAAEFESGMKTANSVVWEYVLKFIQLAMFIYGFLCLYNAIFGSNKQENWIKILLIFAFLIVSKFWPTIYATISGAGSPINAGP